MAKEERNRERGGEKERWGRETDRQKYTIIETEKETETETQADRETGREDRDSDAGRREGRKGQ